MWVASIALPNDLNALEGFFRKKGDHVLLLPNTITYEMFFFFLSLTSELNSNFISDLDSSLVFPPEWSHFHYNIIQLACITQASPVHFRAHAPTLPVASEMCALHGKRANKIIYNQKGGNSAASAQLIALKIKACNWFALNGRAACSNQ